MDATSSAIEARARPARRDGWPTAVASLAVLCWSLGLAGLLVAVISGTADDLSWPDFALGLAYPAVALLAAHVREARRWSALTLMSALASSLNVAATSWADRLYRAHVHPVPGAAWAAWLAGWTWVVSIIGFAAIAYFPDGKLPAPRWRLAPLALAVAGSVIALGNATDRRIGDYGIPSPLPGPRVNMPAAVSGGMLALGVAGLIGCLACIVVKFRRADGMTRRQIGWYGYGYAVTAIVLAIAVTTSLPSALLAIAPVTVAAGAGVAILKYRLYDIDRVVNRTLAWGLITALVIAIYFVCIGFFQRLFAGGGSAGGLLATAIVAVAFQPLRITIQGAVNQLIYGYRDQPDVVFRELAAALTVPASADEPLASVTGTLARALRLPAAALDIDGGPDFRARYASGPAEAASLVQAATAQNGGTRVRVLVLPRGRGGIAGRDRQILGQLAPSLAAAAEAVRLGRALDVSRVRAVAALAEEQRRMRRDLHDGLGPVLAGLRLTIGTAQRLIESEPARAGLMLADAHDDAQAAIEDVRRLAYDLRPPSLDELGLRSWSAPPTGRAAGLPTGRAAGLPTARAADCRPDAPGLGPAGRGRYGPGAVPSAAASRPAR